MNARLSSYQLLKNVGKSAISQTWIAKDTRQKQAPLRIIQRLDLQADDPSLIQFGQTLLHHKAQTLESMFQDIAAPHKNHDYFSEGSSFYIVQAMTKGRALHRLSGHISGQDNGPKCLTQILMLLQQAYGWGLGSCCLHPGDLIWRQSDGTWVWTGLGIFKTIVQQICKTKISLTDLFPNDTAAYFAPEFLQGRADIGSDLYMVGIATIQALTQQPLKELVHGSHGYYTIRRNWYRQTQTPDFLVHTLNRMISSNPIKRYTTIAEVLNNLERSP